MSENILTIKQYFQKGSFVIPNYQRGYKWGVPNSKKGCAVSVLMDNLISSYSAGLDEYYIQGVTVSEDGDSITLIDGQQRTTTFYLLLKYLGLANLPKMNYTIRKESDYVLSKCSIEKGELLFDPEPNKTESDYNLQDIHYFRKAVETIHSKTQTTDKNLFLDWVQHRVKLFYIKIDKREATKIFSMMNGQKAQMKDDELVKAALLSKASRPQAVSDQGKAQTFKADLDELLQTIRKKVGEEWEINTLRSQYAREWDKWLYWWNRKDVKDFFGSGSSPMGLLLEYYFELHKEDDSTKNYNFTNFNEAFFSDTTKAKQHFKGVRDLQKTFEDLFNSYESFNYLGLIIKGGGNKKDALLYLLENRTATNIHLKEYAKWTLVGATHRQITRSSELGDEEETKESKAQVTLTNLSAKQVYGKHDSDALKQLLRRNVELDNNLKRKFDFSIYGEKSLEHIYPKSWENEEQSKLNFIGDLDKKLSVHSIGNLVLIKKNENSQFGAKSFDEKKKLYYDLNNVKWSLKLLHSVSVFSKNKWDENDIEENQTEFLKEIKDYYKIQ
ncbi:DUF262 domain-containing protein [Mangrovibacterium lignilyticum]|uniref:DUF262 domain-containing protein n=1 Tax=Mangrovibacterium lignilyticum TaxID=2668052 RepID=UPI0013D22480|nr:DUF262 domain-containing HNH endonuclease family protein [Mangrovibacterium lignilyticum]